MFMKQCTCIMAHSTNLLTIMLGVLSSVLRIHLGKEKTLYHKLFSELHTYPVTCVCPHTHARAHSEINKCKVIMNIYLKTKVKKIK